MATDRMRRVVFTAALGFSLLLTLLVQNAFAATIGTVFPTIGDVTDIVYDANRNLVYTANFSRNQVDIFSVDLRRFVGSMFTGLQPASLALSRDGNTLYVANLASLTVSAVNLNTRQSVADFAVGFRPDSIAVGADGNVVILGTTGLLRLDPITGVITPVPISPPPTPPAGLPTTNPGAQPANFLAQLVATPSGSLIIGQSTNRIFVYEAASGTVLRSRVVTGLRAILSVSPDGTRFMAGPFLFDVQTLTILGRAGTVNPTLQGGSAFSVEGNDVFASFYSNLNGTITSLQTQINPLNTNSPDNPGGAVIPTGGGIAGATGTPTRAILDVLRSSSLAPELGLRLPEPITSRLVASRDGQNLFANSTSGLLVIPIGQLNNLPILDVSASNIVLSVDTCNRTIATTTVQIRNVGGGNRMTFAAVTNLANAPILLSGRTGLAPATLTISFDPRNVTTRGTLQFTVVLVSPEAVNVEPAILVNLNFRDVGDRGTIVPVTGVGVDLQMDSARQRLYIANYTQDQIEVFSLASQTFLPPIRVGNRPLSMAIVNSTTMVVANSGSENLSIVDLDAMQEVDQISMGPVPINTNPIYPRSIAASSDAILFSAVPLPVAPGIAPPNTASLWQLSLLTHSAFPRLNLGASITGTTTANLLQGRNLLLSPSDGSGIVTVEGNGTLRFYDPLSDTFTTTRLAAVTPLPLRGTASASPDGSFFVIDNLVFNSALSLQGSIAPAIGGIGAAAQTAALGVVISGNTAYRLQAVTAQTPVQTLQRFNLSTLSLDLQIQMPEQVMDITPLTPAQLLIGTRQWPPRATALELGVTGQTQVLPRGMTMDAGGNAYVLTLSGLSVVSAQPSTGRTPLFAAGGVVNTPTRRGPVSTGALISILGSNLADGAKASAAPLPRSLGGVCVTVNEVAIPLFATSSTQIDAQLPTNLAPGRYTVTVRSTKLGLASAGVSVQVNAASPTILTLDIGEGDIRPTLFHVVDGALVTPIYPAESDEDLILYATGLGAVNPFVNAGELASDDPLSTTTLPVSVTIGGRLFYVTWAGLAPGTIGVYQISLHVPSNRAQGDELPIVVTAGSASSGANNAPVAAIQ